MQVEISEVVRVDPQLKLKVYVDEIEIHICRGSTESGEEAATCCPRARLK